MEIDGNRRLVCPKAKRTDAAGGGEAVHLDRVEVPDKSSCKRKKRIHISYDLIGFIPVDVLIKAEQA